MAYEQTAGLINRGALDRDLPMTRSGDTSRITNEFPVTPDQVTEILKQVFGIP